MNESGCGRWLRNRYWVLRHGGSLSNVKGINVCSMENGILEEFKLAPQGIDQATLAAESFKKMLLENSTPLKKILQTMLQATALYEDEDGGVLLASRMEAITVSSVLSQHRNFALLTGQLRPVA